MESLLTTEGLTKKDVVTLILDMLFAGIDTVMEIIELFKGRANGEKKEMTSNKS